MIIINYYISTNTIISAYNELCKFESKNPSVLFTFFLLKGCGYSSRAYSPVSNIANNGYKSCKELSYLFLQNEVPPKKYDFINPFSMTTWTSQSPSEPMKKWLNSRVKNNILGGATTWRPIIHQNLITKEIKFYHNYLEEIVSLSITSSKVNLVALAIWSCRFKKFNKKVSLTDICNEFLNNFNITTQEKETLFSSNNNINLEYSSNIFNAEHIRSLIGNPDKFPTWSTSKIQVENSTDINSLNLQEGDFFMNSTKTEVNLELLENILLEYKQVILSGPPGTSKSYLCNKLKSRFSDVKKIQFHPQYTYQQFIGGHIVDKTDVRYVKGVLLKYLDMITKENTNDDKFLLIIDEINRANISQVFGETLQCLDRSDSTEVLVDGKLTQLSLPTNLYILATMNSSDRTIGSIDHALRRRFINIYCPPNESILIDLCPSDSFISLYDFLTKLNNNIVEQLRNKELKIGHAIFLTDNVKQNDGKYHWSYEKFEILFNYKILPTIEEYCYHSEEQIIDILGNKLPQRLSGNEFKSALEEFLSI